MNDSPVAVLICVYKNDKPDQVAAAIDSLRNQDYSYGDIRIYFGIDGLIPEALERYVQSHPDHFHRVIRNETNRGLAATLNRLIDSLEDEKYVFRMDADDVALPYRFRIQAEFMDQNPQIGICGGSIVEFDDSGHAFMFRNYPRDTAAAKKYICKANPLAHMTVCFRRSVFENEKFRYQRKRSEDVRLWYTALMEGVEIYNLLLPLVLVRMNESMLKRRGVRFGIGEFDAFLLATYSLHGVSWRLVYPFARMATRCTPSFINRVIYKRFRRFLNSSSKDNMPSVKNRILCVRDDIIMSSAEVDMVARRILKELCGLSENEIHVILSGATTSRRAA